MTAWLLSLPDRLSAWLTARPFDWRVAFGWLLAVVLALTLVRYLGKVEEPSRDGTLTKSAFLRWRPQIEGLDRGENIYDRYNYPNPPVMALVLRPFVHMRPFAGAVAWLLLKAMAAVIGFVWVVRLAADPGRPFPDPAAALVALLALHPVLGDLQHGNVNVFIAFLVVGSLELFRRGWDVSAGLTLALAVACKVTPALFVPFFGWKAVWGGWTAARDRTSIPAAVWRGGGAVLAGTAVGLGVWLYLVPGLALGFERNTDLLTSWYDRMVRPFVADGLVTSEHPNQSIPGVVFRLLTHEPSDTVYDDDGKPVPSEYRNVADIGAGNARWIVRGFQAAFVAAVFLLCRAPAGRRQGVWPAAEFALVAVGMLLFSERTWKHHATTTALPMAVLVAAWATRDLSVGRKRLVSGVLVAATVLMTGPSLLAERAQDLCLVYGTHTAAFLLLAGGVCAVMRWEAESSGGTGLEPGASKV